MGRLLVVVPHPPAGAPEEVRSQAAHALEFMRRLLAGPCAAERVDAGCLTTLPGTTSQMGLMVIGG